MASASPSPVMCHTLRSGRATFTPDAMAEPRPCMVKPKGAHIVGKTGRTTDSGNHNHLFGFQLQLSHGFLHGIKNGMIATTRTPAHIQSAFKINKGIFLYFTHKS